MDNFEKVVEKDKYKKNKIEGIWFDGTETPEPAFEGADTSGELIENELGYPVFYSFRDATWCSAELGFPVPPPKRWRFAPL